MSITECYISMSAVGMGVVYLWVEQVVRQKQLYIYIYGGAECSEDLCLIPTLLLLRKYTNYLVNIYTMDSALYKMMMMVMMMMILPPLHSSLSLPSRSSKYCNFCEKLVILQTNLP